MQRVKVVPRERQSLLVRPLDFKPWHIAYGLLLAVLLGLIIFAPKQQGEKKAPSLELLLHTDGCDS